MTTVGSRASVFTNTKELGLNWLERKHVKELFRERPRAAKQRSGCTPVFQNVLPCKWEEHPGPSVPERTSSNLIDQWENPPYRQSSYVIFAQ